MTDTETITVNVSRHAAEKFRKAARIRYGKRKGVLGRAASEALEKWAAESEANPDAYLLKMMEKGFKLGKIIGTRSDWHARKPFL